MSLECTICLEKYSYLKYLSCRHCFCTNCLQKLKKKSAGRETILCPLDRTETILSNGVDGLKTNFTLICEICSQESSFTICWYCNDCEATVCSQCAMKKHRLHACEEFENHEVLSKCATLLKPYAMKSVSEQTIHNFCQNLETALKARLASVFECNNLLALIEDLISDIGLSDSNITSADKSNSILKRTVKLLKYYNVSDDSVNVDMLKQLFLTKKRNEGQTVVLPDVENIVKQLVEQEHKDNDKSLAKCPFCGCSASGTAAVQSSTGGHIGNTVKPVQYYFVPPQKTPPLNDQPIQGSV